MTFGENLFQNLLTIGILGTLALIIYLKMTKQTFIEFIRNIRGTAPPPIEVVEDFGRSFRDIR